jgi:uncharacterized cupredoxin-like copper-binding protein
MSFAKSFSIIAALACAAVAPPAIAHGTGQHAKPAATVKEQKPWGIAGDDKPALRTIEIRMTDNMRFTPDRIQVRQGETVRFVVRNDGQMLHELVIGSKEHLDEHAALMLKFPDMEHDEPDMTHVNPGKDDRIVWNFNRPGEFQFACLVAGHYQAGMVDAISVIPGRQSNQRK